MMTVAPHRQPLSATVSHCAALVYIDCRDARKRGRSKELILMVRNAQTRCILPAIPCVTVTDRNGRNGYRQQRRAALPCGFLLENSPMATRTQAPPKYLTTQVISSRIDRNLVPALDAAARAAGTDRNTLIERLIRAHLMTISPMAASSPPTLTNGHAARQDQPDAGADDDGQPDPRESTWYIADEEDGQQ